MGPSSGMSEGLGSSSDGINSRNEEAEMPASELKLIKRCAEFRPRDDINLIPHNTRGIYVLLAKKSKSRHDVIYIGMAAGIKAGVRGRLRSHSKSETKGKLWTHFSVFEAWDNITEAEVSELEGLFRHIYRKDSRANRINKQRSYRKLKKVRINRLEKWRW
jgi:hypothetical protein